MGRGLYLISPLVVGGEGVQVAYSLWSIERKSRRCYKVQIRADIRESIIIRFLLISYVPLILNRIVIPL